MSDIDEPIGSRCDEISAIVRVMQRANSTGDDVRLEIQSGLILISSIVAEISDLSKSKK
ncbi:hypothetical protein ABMX64_20015 [Vibrio vulnificus]|uniref:hypothetical protein n=1 Tax=Vibrio vulnificus TaxID=672 RepID=UPI001A21DA27|nr:hypothetical protein [Vibrio vulnificus]EGQ7854353.1 hypothetical protein [Vibrio vulnificus]EIE1227626.1 hypothetical protein [Vibrio vulnificus]MCJ0806685.1 hypothetical protein [Vibrio vulnificus]MDK2679262.1 hypothetical protein [Vibrio vulnificus]MDK2688009.1 hypothetical protein [Vibrio vulnificus]